MDECNPLFAWSSYLQLEQHIHKGKFCFLQYIHQCVDAATYMHTYSVFLLFTQLSLAFSPSLFLLCLHFFISFIMLAILVLYFLLPSSDEIHTIHLLPSYILPISSHSFMHPMCSVPSKLC